MPAALLFALNYTEYHSVIITSLTLIQQILQHHNLNTINIIYLHTTISLSQHHWCYCIRYHTIIISVSLTLIRQISQYADLNAIHITQLIHHHHLSATDISMSDTTVSWSEHHLHYKSDTLASFPQYYSRYIMRSHTKLQTVLLALYIRY